MMLAHELLDEYTAAIRSMLENYYVETMLLAMKATSGFFQPGKQPLFGYLPPRTICRPSKGKPALLGSRGELGTHVRRSTQP